MINFASPSLPDYNEYCQKIKEIFESGIFTNGGKNVLELEKILNKHFDSNTSLFCNGTIALMSAIQVLELKGEIITPIYSFHATMNSIQLSGCTSIFCDINNYDLTIDANKIEGLITEKTVAIMPVHVYGNICDYKKIEKLAKKYNLKVIYDAAHSFDVSECSNYGDISMFSLHATKILHSAEGGILTTDNKKLDKKIKLFRGFGIAGEDLIDLIGLNGKMNELCAALGILNFKNIKREIISRQKKRKLYEKLLYNISSVSIVPNTNNSVSYFVIRIKDKRDLVYKVLRENDVLPRKYFYPMLTNKGLYCSNNDLRVSNLVSDEVLALPLHGNLTEENIQFICKIIREVVNG